MSDTTAGTKTTERKPPTLADIVREKTDDGARIIDFFLDVMEGRTDGAELCHRIDAGKQLVKYGSKDAAEFIAKYKGVPCGHSINGRHDPADPCATEERSLVTVTLNAPPTLTRDFLTVLSGIDEFLMTTLIRAQTVDGGTIIDFLYDVMQDTTEGFRTHHRIAAAKELIVHIVRDEQDSTVVPVETGTHPSNPALSSLEDPADNPTVVPVETGTHPSDPALSSVQGPADNPSVVPVETGTHPSDPALSSVQRPADNPTVVPVERGTHPPDPALSSVEGSADNPSVVPVETGTHPSDPALSSVQGPADNPSVVPAKSLPRTRYGAGTQGRGGVARPSKAGAHPEPNTSVVPADAGTQGRNLRAERIEEKKDEKPAPAELTISERRISEKLKQHWHEPEPWAGPIDSTTPGRSPPW